MQSASIIHPTAIIHPSAQIAEGVEIGAYCVIGEQVVLEKNVKLFSHVVIDGSTQIGEGTKIFPFASLGHAPQDLKYHNEPSELKIGKNNTIREHVTMNPGTEGGGMLTKVGDNCLFMVGAHVAHDCQVGNHVILANNATLAGHVEVGDHAIIGGLAAVHQFVRIGHNAMVGGMSGVVNDVIPYGSVMGDRAFLAGLNIVGMKRKGVEKHTINAIRAAFKKVFESHEGTMAERIEQAMKDFAEVAEVADILQFLQADSSRSFCTPK